MLNLIKNHLKFPLNFKNLCLCSSNSYYTSSSSEESDSDSDDYYDYEDEEDNFLSFYYLVSDNFFINFTLELNEDVLLVID